ncbi:MAG: CapA family protein [Lachnospiraceae bacterium]|nr:CapA family protein [Lachnospiraceae bacterium]
MKKKILIVCILTSVLLMNACSNPIESTSIEEKAAELLPQYVPDHSGLYAAVEEILEHTGADFIGHYPVTEDFFYWVAKHYGRKCLMDIAKGGDYSDPNLWFLKTGDSIHVLWVKYCKSTGLDAYDYSHIHEIRTKESDQISIDFSGDVNLAENMATTIYMDSRPNGITDCFSEDLLQEMTSCDLFVVNNEFGYTERGEALSGKPYTFRASPKRVSDMEAIGTDLVTLANNHVWDFGEIGMLDTLDTLEKANMPYVGAGRDLKEAMRPQYYIFGGRKIAIVNATQIERSLDYTKEATATMAGVLKTLHSDKFCNVIRNAKKHSDLVIVCVHWGTEGNNYYGADQVKLAEDFVNAGADAIIGGHTHCLQGIEYIGDVPVYYSLGNYWFASTTNMPASYDTGLARLEIDNDLTITARFIPARFSEGVTSKLVDEQNQSVYSLLETYAKSTTIDKNGVIHKR